MVDELFGLKWSPWVSTKIVRAMLSMWRREGLFVMAYIDDFVVLAKSAKQLGRVRDYIGKARLGSRGYQGQLGAYSASRSVGAHY